MERYISEVILMGFFAYLLLGLILSWFCYQLYALIRDIRMKRKSNQGDNVKVDDDTKNK